MITFSPREQTKLLREWRRHSSNLRAAFEPTYQVRSQLPSVTEGGKKFIMTSWINGHPSVLPPADVVAIMLHHPEEAVLRGYLINQPELFELLGELLTLERLPTQFFQVESLTDPTREQIIAQAQLQSEIPFIPEHSGASSLQSLPSS